MSSSCEYKTVRFDGIDVLFLFSDSEDRRNYDLIDKARFKHRIKTQFEPLLNPILERSLSRISKLKSSYIVL